MAEETEEIKTETSEPIREPPLETPPPKEDDPEFDPTKEPGGDRPEDVYARRRARELRQTREALDREKAKALLLEGENKALKEATAKPQPEKVWTIAEVNLAVEEGKITRVDADRYIDEVILPHRIETTLAKREQAVAEKAPLERAKREVDEYLNLLPVLQDKGSEAFRKVAVKYQDLIGYGYSADSRTERIALEMVHGDLDTLKKKDEIARMNNRPKTIPADQGGNGTPKPNGKIDINKAPDDMKRLWDRTGTDPAARERQFGIYLARVGAKT